MNKCWTMTMFDKDRAAEIRHSTVYIVNAWINLLIKSDCIKFLSIPIVPLSLALSFWFIILYMHSHSNQFESFNVSLELKLVIFIYIYDDKELISFFYFSCSSNLHSFVIVEMVKSIDQIQVYIHTYIFNI